jgi:hypothetical protein
MDEPFRLNRYILYAYLSNTNVKKKNKKKANYAVVNAQEEEELSRRNGGDGVSRAHRFCSMR